jgi:hypothetical protein
MLHHNPLLAGRIALVLAGVSEQVMLVIIYIMSVRKYEIEAVPVSFRSLDRHAAGDSAILVMGIIQHPVKTVPLFALGNAHGIRDEPGGKHFGKDHEVRLLGAHQHPPGILPAPFGIPPLRRRL